MSRNSHRYLYTRLAGFVLVVLAACLGFTHVASAAAWTGRGDFQGYFSGTTTQTAPPFTGGCPYSARGNGSCNGTDNGFNFVLPSDPDPCNKPGGNGSDALPVACVNSVAALYNTLRQYNGSSDPRLHASSAFIVQTMLGRDGAQANAAGGRTISAADWADLLQRMNAEQAAGLIKWNVNFSSADRAYAVWLKNKNQTDVVHYNPGAGNGQTGPAIVFYNAAGQNVYALFRACANPGGNLTGLPQGWKLTGASSVTPTTAQRGQTVTFTHTIHNAGPLPATFTRWVQESAPTNNNYKITGTTTADSLAVNGTRTITTTLTIPQTAQNGDVYCERIAFTNATGPGTANGTGTGVCVKAFVPPVCGNATTTPGQIQPGDKFTTTVNLGLPGGPPNPYTAMHVRIADPAINYTNNNATPLVLTPAGNPTSMSYTLPQISATKAGSYTITWQLFNGAASVGPSCTGTITVNDYPYFSAYGGDVSAGGNFVSGAANSCQNPGGDGVIGSWYNNQTATAGASTLYAALALGQITGFGGGQNSATPGLPSVTGQSFANNGGGAISQAAFAPQQGGNYGGSHCLLTPTMPSGTPADVGGNATVGSGSLVNGAHSHNGNVTLNSGTVGIGDNPALYVTGDVYITGNIVYAGSGGGWTVAANGTSNVPSFTLVATGNIYIDPSVTELDGTYVANGGDIFTCGTNSGGVFKPMAAASLYSSCAQQLTVYGSFVADQVNLMRTFGTLNNATTTETPRSGSHTCANGAAKPVCAAEVFNMSPETYLSSPATQPLNQALPPWNTVTSLPPVL